MIDQWGRKVNYMRISVTDRCNLRCVYCMPLTGVKLGPHDEYLRYEEILRVVKAAVGLGIDRIRVTGGEPLVRQGIVEFLAQLKPLGVTDLSLSTNGLLFAPMAKDLKAAGVDRVNISLDTLRPDRFTKIARLSGSPAQVLEAAEAALELGMEPVKLNMVVIRGWNDDEIGDMARLTLDRPIHVRYIEVMPFSEGYQFTWENLVPAAEMRERLLDEFGDLEPVRGGVRGNGPAKYWRLPGAKGTVGFISAVTECFCAECNRIRLSADGKVNPCLGHVHEVDLKPVIRDPEKTDDDLRNALADAILRKPREHNFDDAESDYVLRVMHGIGG
ncbi:GTP 3',8-cyclase MoaA [Symbiobacterium thermophilum]|uniref:GTP 3',8-cyclase n=2 Tax=Symbiobacterium thermophilum TaxID=2734 RepID=Q67KB1_SYMTH|nr:GTP 3',8-cyclase MoaA [Symbiobacterium thermophilum]MBY6277228.1 GTP 3',8-cyclase MoaA [Symbiobacterium thermophilum]BAD41887.1 molybdenum cofactor biosynthesis protein A [Symbiobacterium thermophilum IAM 14863]